MLYFQIVMHRSCRSMIPSIDLTRDEGWIDSNIKSKKRQFTEIESSLNRKIQSDIICEPIQLDKVNLVLLVDRRERKKNNTYRTFFKTIETYLNDRSDIGSDEATLTVGDFMLVYTDKDDPEKSWVAGFGIK